MAILLLAAMAALPGCERQAAKPTGKPSAEQKPALPAGALRVVGLEMERESLHPGGPAYSILVVRVQNLSPGPVSVHTLVHEEEYDRNLDAELLRRRSRSAKSGPYFLGLEFRYPGEPKDKWRHDPVAWMAREKSPEDKNNLILSEIRLQPGQTRTLGHMVAFGGGRILQAFILDPGGMRISEMSWPRGSKADQDENGKDDDPEDP